MSKVMPPAIMNNEEFMEDDLSDEEIMRAIQASMRELNVPPPTPVNRPVSQQNRSPIRPGLQNVASLIDNRFRELSNDSSDDDHTPTLENQQGLTENESIEKAIQASKIEALSEEDQMKLALEESLKDMKSMTVDSIPESVPIPDLPIGDDDSSSSNTISNSDDSDEDIKKALALSLDPNQQENLEHRNFFSQFSTTDGASAVLGARSNSVQPIYSTEELSLMRPSRNAERKRPKSTLSSRIAANFPETRKEFFNEDLYESQIQEAIEKSKADLRGYSDPTRRCTSLSPRNTPDYSKVASSHRRNRQGSGGPSSQMFRPISESVGFETGSQGRNPTWARPNETTKKRGAYRPVVVDGCNIAFLHGRNQAFSAKGLLIVYDYFKKKGYEDKDIVIIVKHVPHLLDDDLTIINQLRSIGVLHDCPARFAGKELIRSDDDIFVLSTAKEIEGIVLSRDRYQNHFEKHTTYRDVIRNRLIMPTFIGDRLMLPDDPLGAKGPNLDQFLRFDD